MPAGEGNIERKCWIRIPASQPLLKTDLQDHVGVLPGSRLAEVQARFMLYLGLSDDEDDNGPKPEM